VTAGYRRFDSPGSCTKLPENLNTYTGNLLAGKKGIWRPLLAPNFSGYFGGVIDRWPPVTAGSIHLALYEITGYEVHQIAWLGKNV